MKKYFWLLVLILLALVERLWFDMGFNIELVTTAVVLSAMYWGNRESILVVFIIMGISDLVLGNTNIFLFTWSAFLIEAGILAWLFRRIGNNNNSSRRRSVKRLVWGVGGGMGASLFFYAWTNFGVWWLDSWGMYSRNIWGLKSCYINGLPFLKMNLKSSLVLVSISLTVVEIVTHLRTFCLWDKNVFGARTKAFIAKIS